jgi:GntR family transcriptional regulator, transcriptional repressor for pyruvate dehydrogenase complex
MIEPRDLLAKLTALLMKTREQPGARMPSERTLAEHFGVSRGQIREALAILEVLRVVERKAKSGIYLTENRSSIEALAFFAQAGLPLTPEEVYQAVEMRKIHEITAVRLACERAKLENFDRMREVLDRSARRVEESQPINLEDRDFHLEIVRATQNNVFFKIVNVFYLMSERRLPLYFANPDRSRRSHEEHMRIFEALAKRDSANAMALMSAHLQGVESYWNDLISKSDLAAPA